MICPDCHKAVSYADEPEVEIDQEDVEDSEYTVSMTVKLVCAECSTGLKETTIEGSYTIPHDCRAAGEEDDDLEFTVEDSEIEPIERPELGKKGQPLRNGKTYYGAKVTGQVRCERCSLVYDVEVADDCAASDFEEVA